ncbi:peptide chain release factor N(5)-glutamine methyltransferase [Ligilactobacillus aviarius]|uniref:peptide chain release factor N(5)-glutamine methyltransferase n=1 Tax=Ligilactobacillus aviarius TaxID=1606 RepID=UPI00255B698F|nr:peptide chain release factor N(5)-glutamine methyltransferase [Ligilactobacillus aviarius]
MNNAVNYFKARQWAFSFIEAHGLEADAADLLLCDQMGWNEAQLLMHFRDPMPDGEWQQYQTNVQKFVDGWPAQYLTGKAFFYGLQLKVTEATLIPRPETEELVDWILADYDEQPIKLLDVGTGTGAIGLALKAQRLTWDVTLSDISADALAVAKQNATALNESVKFVQSDLLNDVDGKYDVIVSNPPYIAEDERKYMDRSVLEHEPELALFAPHHGLAIYQRIAAECTPYLNPHARMYFEIGFHQGQAVKQIFEEQFPQASVEVRQDINHHDRMVRVKF